MYKLNANGSITRLSDSTCIPIAPGNRDYAEYLTWVATGGVPEPYEPPPTPVPSKITKAQGHYMLVIKGKYQDVIDYIDAITDPTQKLIANIAFNVTNDWERVSPFLNQAALDLGFADQLDDWFIEGAQVVL